MELRIIDLHLLLTTIKSSEGLLNRTNSFSDQKQNAK